jgi:hypothetical protein
VLQRQWFGPEASTVGHIVERAEYEAEDDELAILEARAKYAESKWNAGFEIWDRARLVYRAAS